MTWWHKQSSQCRIKMPIMCHIPTTENVGTATNHSRTTLRPHVSLDSSLGVPFVVYPLLNPIVVCIRVDVVIWKILTNLNYDSITTPSILSLPCELHRNWKRLDLYIRHSMTLSLYPAQRSWIGLYWFHLVRLSVCLSVEWIVSAMYLLQY